MFRPPVSRGAFFAWAVGSMRNSANWQVTTVKHIRGVVHLITAFALERRHVSTLDPDGTKRVFKGCGHVNGDDDFDDDYYHQPDSDGDEGIYIYSDSDW